MQTLGSENASVVTIEVDGRSLPSPIGVSLAAALLRAGVSTLRYGIKGDARGAFCMMGVCQECILRVNGRLEQACLVTVADGMRVEIGKSA